MQIRAQGVRAYYLLLKKLGRKVADYNRKIGAIWKKMRCIKSGGIFVPPLFYLKNRWIF